MRDGPGWRGRAAGLYLDQIKRDLTGMTWEDPSMPVAWDHYRDGYDPGRRETGADWPATAATMIGLARLGNLQHCIETVLAGGVPGDLIETGVWRGGACIFMRAVLKAYGVTGRTVWVADSFRGFPPHLGMAADRDLAGGPDQDRLAVPQAEVERNFARYGLLDSQVRFLPGWFADTLPGPVGALAVLRLDGDLYASTMDALTALYPRLSPGGFCIVDDWNIGPCREAVTGYRAACGVSEPIEPIDGYGVFWRKRVTAV